MLTNLKKSLPKFFVFLAVAMFLSGLMAASALAHDFVNRPETNADDMHIATECVSPPGCMLLFGSALVGLAWIGRKRFSSRCDGQ